MLYKEVPPPQSTARFVKCLWNLDKDYRRPFPGHEHLWADACGELILSFGSPYYLETPAGRDVLPPAFVIGPFRKSFDLHCDGEARIVAARMFPWAFRHLGLTGKADFVDRVLPADAVFGSRFVRLRDEIAALTSDEQIDALGHAIEELARDRPPRDSILPVVWARLEASAGRISTEALADELKISTRTLQRIVRSETGITPKLLARIVMFNHAKRRIERDPNIDLAMLTADAGYADQAHFTKAFREMFGITPGTFKAQVRQAMGLLEETGASVAFLQDG